MEKPDVPKPAGPIEPKSDSKIVYRILKHIWSVYMWGCTGAITGFIILAIMTHLNWIYGFRSIIK